MTEPKRREFRIDISENLDSKSPSNFGAISYEVLYSRTVDGEPSNDLSPVEVTKNLLQGLTDVIGIHCVQAAGTVEAAVNNMNNMTIRLRQASGSHLREKFGPKSELPGYPEITTKSRERVSASEYDPVKANVDKVEDMERWSNNQIASALNNGKKACGDA